MSKYNKDLRIKVAKYTIDEKHSYGQAATQFSIDISSVRKWARKYLEHGEQGLEKNNIKYDGKFRIYVVEYMHSNHLSLNETAIRFNIADHTIVGKWERIYYEEGPQALFKERRGRSKNMNTKPNNKKITKEVEEDLIAQNQRLRIENAYLKKLNALVQERVQRENPKNQQP